MGGVPLRHPFALGGGIPTFTVGSASPEQRAANLAALGWYADASRTLPAGTIEVDVSAGPADLTLALNPSVIGHVGGTVIDAYPKEPGASWHLLSCDDAGAGTITVSDVTFNGPTELVGTDEYLRDSEVFTWTGANGGALVWSNADVTGRPGGAVVVSGTATVTIRDSAISGYVSPVARFDSLDADNPGNFLMEDCVITGVDSGPTSIGIYIGPHIPCTVRRTTFSDFARYGVYQNGTAVSNAPALIEDCTFTRCNPIQSSRYALGTLRRILWDGAPGGPGSPIRGDLLVVDSTIRSGPWTSIFADHDIEFLRVVWEDHNAMPVLFSEGTAVDVRFLDNTWDLVQGGGICQFGVNVTGTLTLTGTVTDTGTTGAAVTVLGTVTLDRTGLTVTTSRPDTFWNLGAGVTVIG